MLEKKAYNKYFIYVVLLLLYLFFAVRYSPCYEVLGSDKEVFQYMGMLIKNNLYPYTDAFDHKPPVIYLINYLGVLLTPNSTWGVFIILNCFGFYSAILIYKLGAIKIKKTILPILICLAFICVNNSNYLLQEANLTRQLTAFFTVFILYVIFYNKKSNLKIGLVGFLIGLIFFTQQNEILGGLILSGYYLLFDENSKINDRAIALKNIGFFTLGLLLPFLIVFLTVNYWGNYRDFINQVFLFNFNNYIDNRSFLTKIMAVIYGFTKVLYEVKILLLISVIMFISLFLKRNNQNKQYVNFTWLVIFLALIFQVLSTSISGRNYAHYFLMFIPYVFCLFIFSLKRQKFIDTKYLSVLLIMFLVFNFIKVLPYKKPENVLLKAITNKVISVKGKHGQFYSLNGRYLRVNFNLDIPSPSKHIYAHFMDEVVANEIIEDLIINDTKYVLYDIGDAHIIPQSIKLFLQSKYKSVLSSDNHILYMKD